MQAATLFSRYPHTDAAGVSPPVIPMALSASPPVPPPTRGTTPCLLECLCQPTALPSPERPPPPSTQQLLSAPSSARSMSSDSSSPRTDSPMSSSSSSSSKSGSPRSTDSHPLRQMSALRLSNHTPTDDLATHVANCRHQYLFCGKLSDTRMSEVYQVAEIQPPGSAPVPEREREPKTYACKIVDMKRLYQYTVEQSKPPHRDLAVTLQTMRDQLTYELSANIALRHPNILPMKEHIWHHRPSRRSRPDPNNSILYMIFDLARTTLLDYINARPLWSEHAVAHVFFQLLNALDYTHQHGYAHRDIKLENIFVMPDGAVKLGDWGLCTPLDPRVSSTRYSAVGSPLYCAPELLQHYKRYDATASDVWALGVVLYALRFRALPFGNDPDVSNQASINGQFAFPSHLETCRRDFRDLIVGMLRTDPRRRFTITAVQLSEWVCRMQVEMAAVPRINLWSSDVSNDDDDE